MELLSILFIILIIVLSYFALTQKKKGLPPGPSGWPIINNYGLISDQTSLYKKLNDLRQVYGDIFHLRFFFTDVIVLSSPDVIRDALVKNADHFSQRPQLFTSKFRKNKGIINNHSYWKDMRKFSLVALRDFGVGKKSLEQTIHEEIRCLYDALDATNGKPFCVDSLMNKSVSNIICSIVFGNRFEYDDEEFSNLLAGLNYAFSTGGGPYSALNFNVLQRAMLITSIIGRSKKLKKHLAIFSQIRNFINDKIKEHKETFDPNDIRDLIDIYLESEAAEEGSKVPMDECFEIIIDLFAAGTETTSTTLKWFILYMMHEPEIQEKCYEEIAKNIGPLVSLKMSDRSTCPYFEATLLEVQRKCTIVPMSLPHTVDKDLYFNGHFFPKGVVVIPNLYSAHHDVKYWGDPDVFRPERWLDADGKIIKHSAFMPFSLGRRACLGEQLANMELFLYASSLIQGFQFEMVDPKNPPTTQGKQGITLLPRPYDMIATARIHDHK